MSILETLLASSSGGLTVGQRFDKFLENIRLTEGQTFDGETKHGGVRGCLNAYYYGVSSTSANSLLVGSWGKHTRIRPPRDIDVLFVLPYAVYERFQQRPGNKQSQLLQEVKNALARTYSTTQMRGDGQVVIVPFTSYAVEVAPAFGLQNGQYWICDTNDGGRYKTVDPVAEINLVQSSDKETNGNTRHLIRMMKCWQGYCNVPIKSFWIEILAIEFLKSWEHRGKSTVYYDWMVRDFFAYLVRRAGSYIYTAGTMEMIYLGDAWKSRAETALERARKACDHESGNRPYSAGEEWQKIFSTFIPAG